MILMGYWPLNDEGSQVSFLLIGRLWTSLFALQSTHGDDETDASFLAVFDLRC